jgi:sRNA-binding regulator protein Hfq
MSKEVYAEEIEAFLERLEGIASARVVANEEGQIDRVFLTTETQRDDGALRRQIGAALMSQYGLHLEGWRLHVAHLRPEPGRLAPARFRLFRIEETLTETATRVLVDLRYEREGAQKTAIGIAQSPSGAAFRLRTVVQATLEAMRPVLEEVGWKAHPESVAIVPFAGVRVALVGISLSSPRGAPGAPQVYVGGEVVRLSETEAVVRAALRALGQVIEEEPPPAAGDRWSRLEAIRAHYHRLISLPQIAAPAPEPVEARAESAAGELPGHPDQAPQVTGAAPDGAPAGAMVSVDVVENVEEIRPETEGGAAVSTREEPYRAEAGRVGGRGSMEDDYYRRLIQSGAAVHIRCRDGYEIPEAVVKDFGTYSLMIEARGVEELVFKHAIISIRPRAALPRDTAIQA